MASDEPVSSYFEMPATSQHSEEYDGSRVLICSTTFLAIVVLVPAVMLPHALLLWTMMVFSLSLGVRAWQVWILRGLSCILFLGLTFLVLYGF